jgi:hypothetical protein
VILDVSESALEDVLDSVDPDEVQGWGEVVAQATEDSDVLRSAQDRMDGCYWFHGTRVPAETSFDEGLQTLPQRVEYVWIFLRSLVSNEVTDGEWQDFRRTVESTHPHHLAGLYRMKLAGNIHHGPYAFLVREILLRQRTLGNHDYLSLPEVVEDICACFQETFGAPELRSAFIKATKPCIVKFYDKTARSDLLPNALDYLTRVRRTSSIAGFYSTSFVGSGTIPKSRIEKVEFL